MGGGSELVVNNHNLDPEGPGKHMKYDNYDHFVGSLIKIL